MTAYLLDVNVLVALSWPWHEAHQRAQQWFGRHADKGWATCPMVEAGFIRIISNPSFSSHAVSPRDAIEALRVSSQRPLHRFWPDDLSPADALEAFAGKLMGYQQVTDLYLLALAIHRKGRLATLDRRIASIFEPRSRERDHLEII